MKILLIDPPFKRLTGLVNNYFPIGPGYLAAVARNMWPFSGYNEIQKPKRKNVLIDYERLSTLLGLESYELVKSYYSEWIEKYLGNEKNVRDDKWTKSIAVGSRGFVESVKSILGILAKGRQSIETEGVYQLRESSVPYGGDFGPKNDDIAPENTYFWDVNL
jgi:hypothetical protein